MIGVDTDPIHCKDLDMTDFRHIADYFLSYGSKSTSATQQTLSAKVMGVRVNCLGDRKMLNKSWFEAVEVLLTDAIFSEHDTSGITDRIGLPIFTRRCSSDPKWAKSEDNEMFKGESSFNNQDVKFLHRSCDPNSSFEPLVGSLG